MIDQEQTGTQRQNETGAMQSFVEGSSGKTKSNAIDIPAIELPKGGGAIKSIDEKFSVNAVNGTASFSIPIPVSDARGFSPSLSLSYSSGSGNGIFGLGWAIDIPSFKRKTEKELPQYKDEVDSDTYIFSGAEDLVPEFKKDAEGHFIKRSEGTYELNESERNFFGTQYIIRAYRPRVEGLFSRIERWTEKNTGYTHWRTISKTNVTSLYGKNAASRIADPKNDKRVFEWFLEFSFDDRGNCMYYEFKPENDQGFDSARHHNRNRKQTTLQYTNTYLKRIFYGIRLPYKNRGEVFSKNAGDYFFETIFDYGEHHVTQAPFAEVKNWDFRSDAFSQYRAGFEIRTTRLCKRIMLVHHFNELPGGSALTRSLELTYGDNGVDGFTFLKEAVLKGYIKKADGVYTTKAYPPFSFDYQQHDWNTTVKAITEDNLVHAPSGIDQKNYHFVDLYNEGLSGILSEQNTGWFYKNNLGDGNFGQAQLIASRPSFNGMNQKVQIMDLEANGVKQLVQWDDEPQGYFELSPEEQWQPFRSFEKKVSINKRDAHVRMLDLNGDGLADLLITEHNVFTWYRSQGKKGFDASTKIYNPFDEEKGPAILTNDFIQSIFLADMDGDGLTDIVRIRNGEVCYWPNLGFGKFGAKITMDQSPVFDHQDSFDPSLIKLADIDGSGTTDIIYTGKNKFAIFLNRHGNGFSPAILIDSFPQVNNEVNVEVIDLLGTGLSCITWNSISPGSADRPLRYIDLMNSRKPHVMTRYKNNLGKEVSLSYAPSTKFYIEDKVKGKPWITKLHFAVHCIISTEIRDRISGTRFITHYKYHHGYFDHAEREFRGFGCVEQTDTEQYDHWIKGSSSNIVDQTLHQQPVLKKSWFHTGAFLEKEKIQKQFEKEFWHAEMNRQGFTVTTPEVALPDSVLVAAPGLDASLVDNLSADEQRQAIRACKSMGLRSEVFALDAPGTDPTPEEKRKQLTPYAVDTHNCVIELLQPKGQNKYAVFVVKESEAITYSYERNVTDPRISHKLNIKLDEFGNVIEAASVVYGRVITDIGLPVETQHAQNDIHITYTINQFTNNIDTLDEFRHHVPSETKTFELKGVSKTSAHYSLADFAGVLDSAAEVQYYQTDIVPTAGSMQKRLIEHLRNIYYRNDLTGALPLHALESRAIPFENYQLAYTPQLLTDIFDSRVSSPMLAEGKFTHSEGDSNWWVRSGTVQYFKTPETVIDAVNRFFVPVSYTDPYGAVTEVSYYSNYFLLVESIKDVLNNTASVLSFNYYSLTPQRTKDANDNLSDVLLDELGLVKASAVFGKGSEADDLTGLQDFSTLAEETLIDQFFNATSSTQLIGFGKDLLQNASSRFVYDLHRYVLSGGKHPVAIASVAREEHFHKNNNSAIQLGFEYSNGLGQVIMKKMQTEPGLAKEVVVNPDNTCIITEVNTGASTPPQLRWVGNGRAILNNKGNAVKQYEPYFSVTHKFEDVKELVESGVTPVMYYDALGRGVRTLLPDGTLSKTEFDSWKQVVYDQNDTVLESSWYHNRFNRLIDAQLIADGKDPVKEKEAAVKASQHANTPATRHTDSLGRSVLLIENNGKDSGGNDILFRTRAELDIEGNLRRVIDARGNIVAEHKFDMLGNKVYQRNMDTGKRWMLLNLAGVPFRTWDERNHECVFEYDLANRPTIKRVKGGDGPIPLDHVFEKVIYGEGAPNDKLLNLRTKVIAQYDTAGKIENLSFDFKGNTLFSTRRFATRYKDVVNWDGSSPDVKLDAEIFTTAAEYDALNRIVSQTSADHTIFEPHYNASGLLNDVQVTQNGIKEWYVKSVHYNEKGQRKNIVYGNDVRTNYFYDRETFRLIRLETKKQNTDPLQDLYYTFDACGNMTHAEDKNIPDIFFNNQKIAGVSAYTYDALNRLIEATGREHIAQVDFGTKDNWDDLPFLKKYSQLDPMAWRTYTQSYQYDAVGNLDQMRHVASSGNWTRIYSYETLTNRLVSASIGSTTYSYPHHTQHGFITALPHLEVIQWNFREELQAVAKQRMISGTPETTYYVYDGKGARLRKITEREASAGATPTKKWERINVGGVDFYREYDTSGTKNLERQTFHVMDDKTKIAMIESRTVGNDGTPARLVRYQFGNHLGAASIETDHTARVISYEEYHPFGTTAYQAVDKDIKAAAKRYRYTGMERDEESGLEYHNARYYLPWLGRWLNADPIGLGGGINDYAYSKNNPAMLRDTSGMQDEPNTCSEPPPETLVCEEPSVTAPLPMSVMPPAPVAATSTPTPQLMSTWPYSTPVPNRSSVGHDVQRDHPIQISVRAEQRGRSGREQRAISSARGESTILVETGRGYFHTELGRLQAQIRERVRSGLITSESQLIQETIQAYEQAGLATGAVVNPASLGTAIISNLGINSETYEQTRRELAAQTGPTTVTDESIETAFTPNVSPFISVAPPLPSILPGTPLDQPPLPTILPGTPLDQPSLPTIMPGPSIDNPDLQIPNILPGPTIHEPSIDDLIVTRSAEEPAPTTTTTPTTSSSGGASTGDYVVLGLLGLATVGLALCPFDGPVGEGTSGMAFLGQAARMGLRFAL